MLMSKISLFCYLYSCFPAALVSTISLAWAVDLLQERERGSVMLEAEVVTVNSEDALLNGAVFGGTAEVRGVRKTATSKMRAGTRLCPLRRHRSRQCCPCARP